MDAFSFFEAAILERIYQDLKIMDYGDFQITYENQSVSVSYIGQSAVLDFSGSVKVKMLLSFDDLVPCFISYDAIAP